MLIRFQEYVNYDALILPSVFEGFGLVIVEATAAGLPVITTAHTIGPDIISNDVNGYVIPIRNSIAIADCVERLLNKSNEELLAMRYASRDAAEDYSWKKYMIRLGDILDHISSGKNNNWILKCVITNQ